MLVNGCDCSIIVKTAHREIDIPFSDETLREAVSFLQEEAPIEGDGICRGLRKINGVKGCVVTPLTIGTAPILLYLAMGACGSPVFISETKNLFKYKLNLAPLEDTENFDLIQYRKNGRWLFEYCRVFEFELRIMRDETIKLKLDIVGEFPKREFPYADEAQRQTSEMSGIVKGRERFKGDYVTYMINGKEYKNIYGITLVSKKKGGTKTEIWIKRALQQEKEIPTDIEEIVITAKLLRDKYEYRYYGTFKMTFKRLVLIGDETEVNTSEAVIGPLRFYVTGGVNTEVFTSGEEIIQ
jgi:hypothetical protein